MNIKQVSELCNLSPDTIRYYEKEKLIPPVKRVSGMRDFDQKDVKWLNFIYCMRHAGLPIKVLKEYVDLFSQGDVTIPKRVELLKQQRETLNDKITELTSARDHLDQKIANYQTNLLQAEHDLGQITRENDS
ncbi:MerR family transcriptional regulator [Lactobacillus sp. ESL0731]|uniref:MerR family transcriptional regulator n=1 Tax=unclassified Lactobacillus TaxID=2620435 RepID=UPI0023F89149|nr:MULTISPECIES: MerR family transcriptional regulator [unclassified Lactobacillus]WEV50806.1 MerR family transcriptional regulator [Lactobacillus sp. ESL0700]WEV61937.1 MerR family transcriptional regulator [Lactobacillus sp. ESL0731]